MATPRHHDDDVLAEVIAQLADEGDEAMVARLFMEDLKDLTDLADNERQEVAAHMTAQLFEEA